VNDGEVWNAAGITSGIDLAASFARVCVDKDVG
jgi:transcriptional regulator GlxA family with amidase domain